MEGKVWLQGIGWHNAKKASEIKVGDTLVWNYGSKSKVTAIVKETEKQVTIETENEFGKYTNRYGKNKMIGYE